MTLAVAFKGPEGIVLAADSRLTLQMPQPGGTVVIPAFFDNATKMLTLKEQEFIGILTSGAGAIGQTEPRSAYGYLPELEEQLAASCGEKRATVEKIATDVGDFYGAQWTSAKMPSDAGQPGSKFQPMQFLVAGFDDGDAYGRIFKVSVPNAPAPEELIKGTFGITFDGQGEMVSRLLAGFDPAVVTTAKDYLKLTQQQEGELRQKLTDRLKLSIPYQFLPLQDCVDLCAFLVNMTSALQGWTTGLRGVGGDVDVATITRTEGFRAIRKKKIQVWGESDD
jgi:hypothetical protein